MSIKRMKNQENIELCAANIKKITDQFVLNSKIANKTMSNAAALAETVTFKKKSLLKVKPCNWAKLCNRVKINKSDKKSAFDRKWDAYMVGKK